MQKIRTNGQLAETTSEELQNLAKKKGVPAPATPVGAAAIGANPDQAKMVGSRQQQQAVTNVSPTPKASLQTAQRTQAPRQQKTAAEGQQAAAANKLQGLGQLGDRVQALANEQLAGLNAKASAQANFNQAQLATLAPTVSQDAVKALLTNYHTLNSQLQNPALAPADKQALQAQLATAQASLVNDYGITNPADYLDVSTGTIGNAAAAQVMNADQLKVSSLDVSQLGVAPADMDGLLGPGWQDLSLGAFKQKIEDVRQAEFSRINGLRAQLATLPSGSAQRAVVLRELADAGQAGVTGVEQGMRDLQRKVDSADVVTIAGKDVAVEELLKDETVSQLVTDFLSPTADPEWKAQLTKENPELVQWIEDNKASLASLSEQMKLSGASFSAVQDSQKALATVGPELTLNDAVMKQLVPDWGKATGSTADLSGNGLYAALTDENISDEQRNALVQKLNGDPKLAAQLAGMSAEEVIAASDNAAKLEQDPVLNELVGGQGKAFLTDPAVADKLATLGPLVDKLRAGGDQFTSLLADENFQKLLKDGQLNASNIDAFLEHPDSYKTFTDYNQLMDQFSSMEESGSIDQALQFLFGTERVSEKSVHDLFISLRDAANIDPTDKAAKSRYLALKGIVGTDGKIDQTEYATLIDRIKGGLEGATLDGIISGADKDKATFSLRDSLTAAAQPQMPATQNAQQTLFVKKISDALANDGKISMGELQAMLPADRAKIFSMPDSWLKRNIPTSGAPFSESLYDRMLSEDTATRARVQFAQSVSTAIGHDLKWIEARAEDGAITQAVYDKLVQFLPVAKANSPKVYEAISSAIKAKDRRDSRAVNDAAKASATDKKVKADSRSQKVQDDYDRSHPPEWGTPGYAAWYKKFGTKYDPDPKTGKHKSWGDL